MISVYLSKPKEKKVHPWSTKDHFKRTKVHSIQQMAWVGLKRNRVFSARVQKKLQ